MTSLSYSHSTIDHSIDKDLSASLSPPQKHSKGDNITPSKILAQPRGGDCPFMSTVSEATPSTEYVSNNVNSALPVIMDVDLNIELNGFCHKTWMYSCMKRNKPQLVVRRGQPFRLAVKLSCQLGQNEEIRISFYTKDNYSAPEEENTFFHLIPAKAQYMMIEPKKWAGAWDFVSTDGKILYIQIWPSGDCIIGKWYMDVYIDSGNQTNIPWKTEEPFYVLFNAWSKDDEAFLPKYSRRCEYVINNVGKIFRGVQNSITHTYWKYAQYNSDVLDFALNAMTKFGQVPLTGCYSLPYVAKCIAESVTFPTGILVEKEVVNADTRSTEWTGTATIIQEYNKINCPVKYVQPHVIPAVIVSCLRSLGIAARNITSFNWANNPRDGLYSVDMIYTNNEFSDVKMKDIAISCYLVLSEVWFSGIMGRKFSCWAPVTASNGPFPVSLFQEKFREDNENEKENEKQKENEKENEKIIENENENENEDESEYENETEDEDENENENENNKEQEIEKEKENEQIIALINKLENDQKFFYGGFNAECIIWKYFGINIPVKLTTVDFDKVSNLIVTKSTKSWAMDNITEEYKIRKYMSKDERKERIETIRKHPMSERIYQQHYANDDFREVAYKLIINKNLRIDENMQITLSFHNFSHTATYNLEIRIMVTSVLSTGAFVHSIKDDRKILTLDPNSARKYSIDVPSSDYIHKLTDECLFKITGQVYVREKSYDFYIFEYIRAILPELQISLQPFLKVNSRNIIELNFTNTSPELIPEAIISLEEIDGKRIKTVKKKNIPPLNLVLVQLSIMPLKKGTYHLAAIVDTKHWRTVTYARLKVPSETLEPQQLHWLL